MNKTKVLVQDIDSRVKSTNLIDSMEKQIKKLLRSNQIYLGIIVFSIFALVGILFFILGTDYAIGIIFITLPLVIIAVKFSMPIKDKLYYRQLDKLGRKVKILDKNKPLVIKTTLGRGFLDVKDGVLRLLHTNGLFKEISLSDITSIEAINVKDSPFIYAIFSTDEVICFFLVDDVNGLTHRKVTTNNHVALEEIKRMNSVLQQDFFSRLEGYSNIKIYNNAVNKSQTEISTGKSVVIIVVFSIVAISSAILIYFLTL